MSEIGLLRLKDRINLVVWEILTRWAEGKSNGKSKLESYNNFKLNNKRSLRSYFNSNKHSSSRQLSTLIRLMRPKLCKTNRDSKKFLPKHIVLNSIPNTQEQVLKAFTILKPRCLWELFIHLHLFILNSFHILTHLEPLWHLIHWYNLRSVPIFLQPNQEEWLGALSHLSITISWVEWVLQPLIRPPNQHTQVIILSSLLSQCNNKPFKL